MRLTIFAIVLCARLAFANASGAIGYSGKPGTSTCNTCHSGGSAPTVQITGPSILGAGATGTFTLRVSGGSGSKAGMNVAASDALAALNPAGNDVSAVFGELCHSAPKSYSGGAVTFQFSLSAPPSAGTVTLYAAGNSVNGNGATSGDAAATTSFAVTVTAGSGMNPPVITTAAAAALNPLSGKSTTVTVLAADDGTEANLTYTWSSTGPGPVLFAPNGSNAAKSSTATFAHEGDYVLTVTVRDGTNKSVTSTINLTVQSVFTALRLIPVAVQVAPGAMQQFTASALNQFEVPEASQPTVTFDVPAGGGSITQAGLFKAQSSPGGPFVVQASAGTISTSSTVSVGQSLPPSSDTEAPTASLIAPQSHVPLELGLMLEAVADDNVGVAQVSFTVADVPIATVTSPPWRVAYTTLVPILPPGEQNLLALATDLAGNQGRSSSVVVVVPMSQGTGGGSGGGGAGGGSAGGASGAGGGDTTGGSCGCTSGGSALVLWGALAQLIRRRGRARSRCGWSQPRTPPPG